MKRIYKTAYGIFVCLALLAFGGALGAQPLPTVKLRPVFPALTMDRPVWMSEAPDGSGRFFIVAQEGRIVIARKGTDGAQSNEFLNIVDREPSTAYEEGLLSIAFHPGFKSNGLFYIYYNQPNTNYSQTNPNSIQHSFFPRRSVISELKVSAADSNRADMKSERILLEVPQPFANHKGGQLTFGPDGYLYLGLGDGGLGGDPFNNAQNSATLLGKMLRIDVNTRSSIQRGKDTVTLPYGIPSDNPFVNEPDLSGWGARREVYAWGLRNPWRYSFDRQTGELWVGDVGQDLWEEIDLVVKGGNYGWNVLEGFHHYKPGPPGAQYIDPIIEYPHNPALLKESKFPRHGFGACVIGGYVYRGAKYPALQGVYLYADYALGTIFGLRCNQGKLIDYGTLLEQPKNITSFAEDAGGELYVLTYDGHVYAVTVVEKANG
jgi:glucose/arabinose dehydrogenase